MADHLDDAVRVAMRDEAIKTQLARRMALELAAVAKLTLERANFYQAEAGHPQRFLVAVDDAGGDSRPPMRVVTPDGKSKSKNG